MSEKLEPLDDLKMEEADSAGDNLTATIAHDGGVYIEIEEPWSGDTETGFGRSGSMKLSRSQVELLVCWLSEALDRLPKEAQ